MSPPAPPRAPSTTVEKAVDVLFHLHGSPESRGVTSIAKALELPKSSVHRLVTTLARRGLVEQDERGRYRPGIGLVALGLGALAREPVVAAARVVLEEEAEELGETFFLVGLRAGALVVLDKAEGTGFLRAAPQVGSTVPVHATAVGKLYLAFAPDEIAMPAGRLESYTSRTAGSVEELRAQVDEARAQGWAANVDEWITGLSVLAAPVVVGGRMAAAVVVALPSQRLPELGQDALVEKLVAAGTRIAARLEGRGR